MPFLVLTAIRANAPARGRMAIAILALATLGCVGCGAREPYSHTAATGKLCYEDGSLIPADGLVLTFISQTPPVDPKTYPKPGVATVDRATGEFHSVTTHKPNDGLIRGKHKVTVTTFRGPAPKTAVPPEYADPATTPLEADTTNLPFELKIRKPR